MWGDQAAGVMATGEALHEKRHATHRRSAVGTDLLVSRESAKEQDDEPYIGSRGLLTMAKLKG